MASQQQCHGLIPQLAAEGGFAAGAAIEAQNGGHARVPLGELRPPSSPQWRLVRPPAGQSLNITFQSDIPGAAGKTELTAFILDNFYTLNNIIRYHAGFKYFELFHYMNFLNFEGTRPTAHRMSV